jgi:ferredoxin-NADP reductase
MALPITKWRIRNIVKESSNIKTWQLEPLGHPGVSFVPGQFILLYLLNEKGVPLESRPYSISSSPLKKGVIELTIKDTPNFPAKLEKLGIGGTVGIAGPMGVFTLEKSANDSVFIVGGVGVAGVSSAVRWLAETQPDHKMVLLYSEKTRDKLIWQKEFEALEKKHRHFKAVLTLTREQPAGWQGELGRIDEKMILKYTNNSPASKFYYICGSPEMVDAIEKALLGLGVLRSQIKYEKWGGISGD